MSELNITPLGYVKYYGEVVEAGLMDTRKSADALNGFDEVLRYCLYKEDPSLRSIDFEFPVKIQEGSWEISIPENIASLMMLGGGTVLTTYASTLAVTAAKDGLLESGPVKDLKKTVPAAMKAFQKIVEIAKYCGKLGQKTHENVKPIENDMVEITRDGLEPLVIPYEYYKLYAEAPASLLSKAASVIEEGREMEIGVKEESGVVRTQVTIQEKWLFSNEKNESDDIVLPELVDGQRVELEGEVTRCAETANTIGFCYNGHVLTCKPQSGSILPFKQRIISKTDDHIFTPVKMRGLVVREAVDGHFKDKKPHIVFDDIVPVENDRADGVQSEFDVE